MPPTPADVLARMVAGDPGRPRVTFYEDTPGGTQGERIELSAKVLANWVSKAANALQDEWDLGPGSVVRLDLPAHWRALYWALAVWSVGATVLLDEGPCDLLVTAAPAATPAEAAPAPRDAVPVVVVTLPALARTAAAPLPPGTMDEARELATYADQFAALSDPGPTDPAVVGHGWSAAYDEVVPHRDWDRGTRVHIRGDDLPRLLEASLAAWAVDGSVVVSRGPEPRGGRAERLASEGVTVDLTA
ncbi:TIGR03089 family protein [Phycicoccus sp. M110.8]|uniref:TIGR03089 family protein n=1 Tax=Phycicoccus sp. M110.8 TaxID=3075433 RepID=UPI0028FDB2E9|nr:TIGR03089 family protein [Phycicoccus sp. M110.8]MDU0312699.1 TIGR03089 family protein [Phycicoccus sp. M110.8]